MSERTPGQPPTHERPIPRDFRPPQVRRYLDALVAEIRKRKERLGIATAEDARRVAAEHPDVAAVTELARLASAFRAASEADAVTEEETAWVESLEAPAKGAAAFREFVGIVESTVENPDRDIKDSLAVIRSVAAAGAPELAWMLYGKTELVTHDDPYNPWVSPPPVSKSDLFAFKLAIWESYTKTGLSSPIGEDELVRLVQESWSGEHVAHQEACAALVRSLCVTKDISAPLIRRALDQISEMNPAWDTLFFVRNYLPDEEYVTFRLDQVGQLMGFHNEGDRVYTKKDQVRFWFGVNQPEKALEIFKTDETDWEMSEIVAGWCAKNGRAEEAFGILDLPDVRETRVAAKMTVGFLQNGDVKNAARAFDTVRKDRAQAALLPDEDREGFIVEGISRGADGREMALHMAKNWWAHDVGFYCESMRPFINAMAALHGAGEDVRPFLDPARRQILKPEFIEQNRLILQRALLEIDTLISLSNYKRAVRAWTIGDRSHLRTRREWNEKLGDAIGKRTDLEESIEYNSL